MNTHFSYAVKPSLQQMASHEMFTPLAVIHAYTQLLQQQTYGPLTPQQRNAILKIEQNSRTLRELFNAKIAELELLESAS